MGTSVRVSDVVNRMLDEVVTARRNTSILKLTKEGVLAEIIIAVHKREVKK